MRRFLIIAPVAVLIVLLYFFLNGLKQDPRLLPSTLINKTAPAFQLQDLQHPERFHDQSIFKNHMTLLIVWASWCESCIDEASFLLTLKKNYPHLQLVGLDEKDQRLDALKWLKQYGNPFDLILQDSSQSDMAINYGVYGTPETFLINADGVVVTKQVGALSEESFRKNFSDKV